MVAVFSENEIDVLAELMTEPKNVIIVVHASPDGDAIGSSCALGLYLSCKGHDINIFCPDNYPEYLEWIPGIDKVKVFENDKEYCTSKIEQAEIIFMLDHNNYHREGGMKELIKTAECTKVMIDHHPNPIADVDYLYSTVDVTSTSEMIYGFISALGDVGRIDKDIATGIYVGINTDTGGLSYNSSFPETYRIVADLLERGIDKPYIHEVLYNTFSLGRMQLWGHSITNKMQICLEGKAAIIALSRKDFDKYSYKDGDTEGLVNFPLNMKNIMISVFVAEKTNMVKLSFRSKHKIPINLFASKYFNGGGHLNAAGGRMDKSLEETVNRLVELLPVFAKEYNI